MTRLLAAFEGTTLDAAAADVVGRPDVAGVTLFHHANVESAEQLRELTDALQRRRADGPPLLVAIDQEGGQLLGLGRHATPWPSAMALGAAGDPDLTQRIAHALGTELRALGVTVDYAPVADLATNPGNPAMGIRAFGDEPRQVAAHVAAFVRGLAAAGVAATAKHFPGKGDVAADTHHGLAAVRHDRARFDAVELAPFRAALAAGVDLVMSGHHAVPAFTGRDDLPATLAAEVMRDLLRHELGFEGVTLTDALDMKALAQGDGELVEALAALHAGVDLLLCPADLARTRRLADGLAHAERRGLVPDPTDGRDRVCRLRERLAATPQPGLEVVRCAAHDALAAEAATRAVTLVKDEGGLLPLRLAPDATLLAIQPRPTDLTPADVSSTVAPQLADALRGHLHGRVEALHVAHTPTDADLRAARDLAARADAVVVGTVAAHADPRQAALVHEVLGTGTPTVTVALRTPWDLQAYPAVTTHLCTYGILRPELDALARVLGGDAAARGTLPVQSPGGYGR